MKLYISMPPALKPYFEAELEKYQNNFSSGNLKSAWNHLERAHILGQKYPYAHTLVHWRMLQFGISIKSGREVLGQIPRLIFGGLKSFVGKIPVGNPGGANVPPLKSFPIQKELKAIFIRAGVGPT